MLKLEFWHFPHPELNFASAFASVFAVFYSKKVSQPPGTGQKRVDLCISHRFCSVFSSVSVCVCVRACVCVCFAFRIGFYSIFADSRLSAHAGLDLHLFFGSVRGWGGEDGGGGGGGVMTDDVHANATCVFCFSCCFLCVSNFASVLTVFLPTLDFCTCQLRLRLAFVFQLRAGVGGGWGGG